MGVTRKNICRRAEDKGSLGFYAGIIVSVAALLGGLSRLPQGVLVVGWGFVLLAVVFAYPMFAAIPQRTITAVMASLSLAGVVVWSCYLASRRSFTENLAWFFMALVAILIIQVMSTADLVERLEAVVTMVSVLAAAHMGVLWLMIQRDVRLGTYIGMISVIIGCGAFILFFPLTPASRAVFVLTITTAGLVLVNYFTGGMKFMNALCVGFTCGIIIVSGSRYVDLLTRKSRLEGHDAAAARQQRSTRVQLFSGFVTVICIGVMAYFFGALFVL